MDANLSLAKLRFTNQELFADRRSFSQLDEVHAGNAGSIRPADGDRANCPGPAPLRVRRIYGIRWPVSAAPSNSPFRAPSIKHSHSFLSNTKTRAAGSPATRISTQSPRAHSRLSGKATPDSTSDVYDGELSQLVRDFQRAHRLNVDGVAGVQTLVVLNSALAKPDSPQLASLPEHGT